MKYISKQKKKKRHVSLSLSLSLSPPPHVSLCSLFLLDCSSPSIAIGFHLYIQVAGASSQKKKKKAKKLVTYSKSLENSTHIHFIHYICLSWQLHVILRLATIHVIFVWKSLINCIEKMQWLCIMKLFAQLINKGLYCKSEAIVGFFFFLISKKKNFIKRKYYFIPKRWSSLKNICTGNNKNEIMFKRIESLWTKAQSY